MQINEITGEIVDAAYRIHIDLGPGMLESVYEMVLAQELKQRGLLVCRQVPVTFRYRGVEFHDGFRVDLLVDNAVIVELKSIEKLLPVHTKQVASYLRLLHLPVGLLLNFGCALMRDGVIRVVNNYQPPKSTED